MDFLLNETSSGGRVSNPLLAVYALGEIVSAALDIFSTPPPPPSPPPPEVGSPTTPPPSEMEEIVDEFTEVRPIIIYRKSIDIFDAWHFVFE